MHQLKKMQIRDTVASFYQITLVPSEANQDAIQPLNEIPVLLEEFASVFA